MLDVDIEKEDNTVQALVYLLMSGFLPSATVLSDACVEFVICTSPEDSGCVAVLEEEAARGLTVTAGFETTGLYVPLRFQ